MAVLYCSKIRFTYIYKGKSPDRGFFCIIG